MEKQRTIVHLVRHGEVENPDRLRYGRLPGYHLSAAGRHQVEQASLVFLKRTITHMYASPLERTQQTATLLGITLPHVAISLDARLLEIKTSSQFEGHTRALAFGYPKHHTADAETKEEVIMRFQHFLEEKIIAHHGQEIIAVSHGDPIAFITNKLIFDTVTPDGLFYPAYASVFRLVFRGLTLESAWYASVPETRSVRT